MAGDIRHEFISADRGSGKIQNDSTRYTRGALPPTGGTRNGTGTERLPRSGVHVGGGHHHQVEVEQTQLCLNRVVRWKGGGGGGVETQQVGRCSRSRDGTPQM